MALSCLLDALLDAPLTALLDSPLDAAFTIDAPLGIYEGRDFST